MSTDVRLALVTAPSEGVARDLARTLVERRLAACVNVVPGIRSIYRWDDAVQDDGEVLLVVKTTTGRFDELRATVVELHPYDVPEVLGFDVAAGHAPYLAWVARAVGGEASD